MFELGHAALRREGMLITWREKRVLLVTREVESLGVVVRFL